MSIDFRQDINGLRGWAVLLVTLYHYGISWLPGGFIGVDVFFVISGFLMTAIIMPQLDGHRFSLTSFYFARIRRIAPALVFLCAALLVLGWFIAPPAEYKKIASHSAYSLTFTSNIEYWLEAGYFDELSSEKWLLHTWSLSVEWQFYLIYPIALIAIYQVPNRKPPVTVALVLAALASFVATIATANINPNAAFFLLHTRAWEMLLGGIVYQLLARASALDARIRMVFNWTGLVMILLSAHLLNANSDWPGLTTLLPTLGAALILLANQKSFFTSHPVLQWLGTRSYSIYLWHWPIWVLMGHFYIQNEYWFPGLLASLVLGALSYRFVEKPASRFFPNASGKAALAISFASLMVAGSATVVWAKDGQPERFSERIQTVAGETHRYQKRRGECHPDRGYTSPSCAHGGSGETVILIGDSHANAIADGLIAAAAPYNAKIIEWTYSGCNFTLNLKTTPNKKEKFRETYDCEGFIQWVQSRLDTEHPTTPVVIENRYAAEAFGANERKEGRNIPGVFFSKIYPATTEEFINEYAEQLERTACTLARTRKVFLVRPIPEMGFNIPKILSHRMIIGINEDLYIQKEEYMKRNKWVWDAQDRASTNCGVEIIDPTVFTCNKARCFGSIKGVPLYHDDDHIGNSGNRVIAPAFLPIFDKDQTSVH